MNEGSRDECRLVRLDGEEQGIFRNIEEGRGGEEGYLEAQGV